MKAPCWLLAVSALLGLGCSGTETGNPGEPTTPVKLAVHSSNSDILLGPGAGGTRVESVWLKVSSADRSDCAAHEAVSASFATDLLAPGAAAALDLTEGPLCSLELALAPESAPPPGSPIELAGASIVVSGTRADGAPFVVSSASMLPITLQSSSPIDPSHYAGLLVAFDVGIWFDGTDLASLALDDKGVARLDGVTHPSTVDTFDGQIAPSAGLYVDVDGDGTLDDEDLEELLAGH